MMSEIDKRCKSDFGSSPNSETVGFAHQHAANHSLVVAFTIDEAISTCSLGIKLGPNHWRTLLLEQSGLCGMMQI